MDNVYIIDRNLKIRRLKYSWNLGNDRDIRIRLEYRVKDMSSEGITPKEYQDCIILLLKGGYIDVMSF